MEEFFWRRLNEKGATEPESSWQLTNVSISISHYSWLKHGSLPLCKCASRAVVWHLGPETWCNISESWHSLCMWDWAAEQQHLPREHWRLLLLALKDLYNWTLHQNKSFNLHFLSMSVFFGVSCLGGIQPSMMSLFKRQMLIIPAIV